MRTGVQSDTFVDRHTDGNQIPYPTTEHDCVMGVRYVIQKGRVTVQVSFVGQTFRVEEGVTSYNGEYQFELEHMERLRSSVFCINAEQVITIVDEIDNWIIFTQSGDSTPSRFPELAFRLAYADGKLTRVDR